MNENDRLDFPQQAPIGDVVRSVYYDSKGEPFYTEWQPLEAVNGEIARTERTVGITGIRPGGIGEAIARTFATAGYDVVACDQNKEAGLAAVERIRRLGGNISFTQADVSTKAGVEKFMDEIEHQSGRLDVLVCNAGSAGNTNQDNWMTLTPEEFSFLLQANLVTSFLTIRGALHRFFLDQPEQGVITLIGTQNGQRGMGNLGQVGYGTAKLALAGLLSTLVAQFGRRLRVNQVNREFRPRSERG